ncbi:PREDICTED: uncharacterized protein LOC107355384 [Acropora digitifera]|uniref:uncharacterized protein LOC107355384 n=1 Tax=Acropora digitifera TaxID=70779 RepID=UPI00077A6D40|nr:PREDICTED: uncharacterized protein LOC107355384 [Acropora digitifera]XP_015777455.1 PREDICTED: uncharacterized protein LOC107355384 [Acropora digitifera]
MGRLKDQKVYSGEIIIMHGTVILKQWHMKPLCSLADEQRLLLLLKGCVKQLSRVKSREEVVKNLLESSDNSTVGEEESKQAELMKKKEDIKQELTELRNKKKNLSDNFSMEKRKYKEEVKEMKAQKQKEVLTRRKNERFVTQKEM